MPDPSDQLPATRYCRFPLVTPEPRQREGGLVTPEPRQREGGLVTPEPRQREGGLVTCFSALSLNVND